VQDDTAWWVHRTLADAGTLFVKLWFHLGKKAQRRRLKELSSRKTTRFRAILVESVHVKGKWRHRHVASIGSFVAETLDVEARRDFWAGRRKPAMLERA
jgi:hypothetical protein